MALAATARSRQRAASGGADAPIKVSYQPALYWALPYYVATREEVLGRCRAWCRSSATFPAGAPQIAAAAGQVLGRRRHRLGAGGARRGALRPPDHRHHQRRVEGQRADGAARDKFDAVKKDPVHHQGPEDPAHHQLDRRLRGAGLPQEMGNRQGRCATREPAAKRRSSRLSPPTTATLRASGRPTTTRWRRRPTRSFCAAGTTPARSCLAR